METAQPSVVKTIEIETSRSHTNRETSRLLSDNTSISDLQHTAVSDTAVPDTAAPVPRAKIRSEKNALFVQGMPPYTQLLAPLEVEGALPLERLAYRAKKHPGRNYLYQSEGGRLRVYTWGRVYHEARRMAAYLLTLGLPPGSRIALVSKNCAHWVIADYAIWLAGHVSVPLYSSLTPTVFQQILIHAGVRALFAGKTEDWALQRCVIPDDIHVIGLPALEDTSVLGWEALIADRKPINTLPEQSPEKLATIIYTSGTTGAPKGVMHSFGAMAFAAGQATSVYRVTSQDRVLSYMPLSHVAERLVVELASLYVGYSVYFVDHSKTFLEDIRRAKPTLFFGVPRIWRKIQEGIMDKIPEKVFDTVMRLPLVSFGLRRWILTHVGLNNVRLCLSGGAPLAEPLMLWYRQLGLSILETYGLTENMGYSHSTRENDWWLGSVGTSNPGVTTKLSASSEVLVRSATTMMGYYNAPKETQNVFTQDGFLRTGDLGVIDAAGHLMITGRIKELFKTTKGKYVTPSVIENWFTECADVDQVCLMGEGFDQPVALVTLTPQARSTLQLNPHVRCALLAFLETLNEKLDRHEQLSHVVVVLDRWSTENDMLTPTLKIKRHVIESYYRERLSVWVKERFPIVIAEAS